MKISDEIYQKALKIKKKSKKQVKRFDACVLNNICPICGSELKFYLIGEYVRRRSCFWNAILGARYVKFSEPRVSSSKNGYDYKACFKNRDHYYEIDLDFDF